MTLSREEFARRQRGMRGPAWRSKEAQEITNVSDRSLAQLWDPLTIAATKYFALRSDGADGPDRAAAAFPKIEAAVVLHHDVAKTDIIKLLILVDFPVDVVAQRVGGEPEVVETWEQLFFDVRPMHSAMSWLSSHVVGQERQAGNGALAARMKLALVAGVDGVNSILAMDQGAPVDEAERIFQRKLQLSLKFEEAAGMPIDSERSRMAFIKLYVHLQMSERQLELAGKKLAARCAQEQREAAAASAQELTYYARLAQQKAAACRGAQSPLAQLTWGKSKPEAVTSLESIALFDSEKQAEGMHQAAEWAAAYDTADDPPHEVDCHAEGLEVAIAGGG